MFDYDDVLINEYLFFSSRDLFDEHLRTHYNPNRLPGEPPVPETIESPILTGEKMKIHIQKHEKAINYPVINTQGKVKLNICKICNNYVGITKVEYWRHYKIHVDLDKRLSCPYCPFISNLKHHYEYHMNKQLGIKPFKCEECTYECVNKSMLSSHKKSHTDLRQFSCQSCSYVTKYCHSLKIHLRRNNHLPGPVLNPDGTVNHLSTVDVYGKRRGPKQKKQTSGESSNQVSHPILNGQNQPSTSQISLPLPPPPPPPPPPTPSNPSTSHALTPQASTSNDYQQANMMNQMFNSLPAPNPFSGAGLSSMLAMNYNNLLRNGFPTAEPYMMNDQLRTNVIAGFMAAANQLQQNEIQQEIMNYYYASSRITQSAAAAAATTSAEARDQCQEFLDQNVQSLQVLDLSRNNTSDEVDDSNINNDNNRSNSHNNNVAILMNNNVSNEEEEQQQEEERQVQERTNSDQSINGFVAAASTPRTAGTSRRKGRAVKLNRRVVENDDSIAENEAESPMTERGTPESYGSTMDGRSPIDENDATHHRGNPFECTYCQIIFGNEVMYTVHMGYHGYKNPYTCNMCGQVNNDAISFNVHLSRARHS